jgi:hypothetical protein
VAFAQANFALRLQNGRRRSSEPTASGDGHCVDGQDAAKAFPSSPSYCDADDTYRSPSLEAKLHYQGSRLT